jgi:hypothetical protein
VFGKGVVVGSGLMHSPLQAHKGNSKEKSDDAVVKAVICMQTHGILIASLLQLNLFLFPSPLRGDLVCYRT